MCKGGEGLWRAKNIAALFLDFSPLYTFQKFWKKGGVQKPNTFSEANKRSFTLFCCILQNVGT